MDDQRWREILHAFTTARELPASQRRAYAQQIISDPEALAELLAMLDREDSAGSSRGSLSPPAGLATGGEAYQESQEWSRLGKTFGRFVLTSPLGRGGMGEVYRARDTELNRTVALKFLSSGDIGNTEGITQFLREARAASALSHPGVVTIFDVVRDGAAVGIVMELIEGVPMREVCGKPHPAAQVEDWGRQVARALAAAHAAGIVHRDIKPENLMLRPDGIIKVLDFGLARNLSLGSGSATSRLGLARGTIRYMSPEQCRGETATAASDVFALGITLYEWSTGQHPFDAGSPFEVAHKIAAENSRPPSAVNPEIPPALSTLILQMLSKDPAARCTSAEVAERLRSAEEGPGELRRIARPVEDPHRAGGWRTRLARQWLTRQWVLAGMVILTAISLLIAGYFLIHNFANRAADTLAFVSAPLTAYPGYERYASFSPDGKQVAFSWNGGKPENYDIYVSLVGSGTPLRLTSDPDEDTAPAWSPDGSSIAFVRRNSGKATIMLIPALGGRERKLAEMSASQDALYAPPVSWSPDGRWLAVAGIESEGGPIALWLIAKESGERRRFTAPPATSLGDSYPAFSQDGRTLAFVRSLSLRADDVYVLSLDDKLTPVGEPRRLTSDNRNIAGLAWTPDGNELVFSSSRSGPVLLWRLAISGNSEPQRLSIGENGILPSISRQGNRLAYSQSISDANIWRVNLDNPQTPAAPVIASSRNEHSAQYSPDGKKIAFESDRSGYNEAWVSDADGSHPFRLVTTGRSGSPRWSPDGEWIVFDSNVDGLWQIFVVSAQGGAPRRVTKSAANDVRPSWSLDGKWIYFASNRSGQSQPWQIWKVSAAGGDPVQITRQGGFCPFPSRDGKTIFFAKSSKGASPLWKAPVEGGEESQVLDSVSAFASEFAVARGGIYYFSGPHLQYLDFARGTSKSILTMAKPTGLGLAVSPDEHWLLYAQIDLGGSDLMLVENFH